MYKILKCLGFAKYSYDIILYELEGLGFMAVENSRSHGEISKAWMCDQLGYPIDGEEDYMWVRGIFEPTVYDEETGEPCVWDQVGFEINP